MIDIFGFILDCDSSYSTLNHPYSTLASSQHSSCSHEICIINEIWVATHNCQYLLGTSVLNHICIVVNQHILFNMACQLSVHNLFLRAKEVAINLKTYSHTIPFLTFIMTCQLPCYLYLPLHYSTAKAFKFFNVPKTYTMGSGMVEWLAHHLSTHATQGTQVWINIISKSFFEGTNACKT